MREIIIINYCKCLEKLIKFRTEMLTHDESLEVNKLILEISEKIHLETKKLMDQ